MDFKKITNNLSLYDIKDNWLIIAISVCINICALAIPIYTLQVYDRIITSHNMSTYVILTTGALAFVVLEFIFRFLRGCLSACYANKTKNEEFIRAINQFARLYPQRLVSMGLSEKMELMSELNKANEFIHRQFYVSLVDIIFLIFFLLIITLISARLGLFIFSTLTLFIVLSVKLNQTIIRGFNRRNHSDKNRLQGIISFLRACFIAKNFTNDALLLQKQDIIERKSVFNTYRLSGSVSGLYNLSSFTSQIIIAFTLVIGAKQVMAGDITFGSLIAIIIIAGRLTNPIKEILTLWFRFVNFVDAKKRIAAFYNEPVRKYIQGGLSKKKAIALHLEQVCVRANYKTEAYAIQSLTLSLYPGQCIAITNLNTNQRGLLKKLLTGTMAPDKGSIRIAGHHLNRLSSEQYFRNVSYLTIEDQFINQTIKENITGCRAIPEEDIDALCDLFSCKQDILKLEHGFQTVLNTNTLQELPQTLKIKIQLARAYLFHQPVVIVDMDGINCDHDIYRGLFNLIRSIRHKSAILILTNDLNLKMLADQFYDAQLARFDHYDPFDITDSMELTDE